MSFRPKVEITRLRQTRQSRSLGIKPVGFIISKKAITSLISSTLLRWLYLQFPKNKMENGFEDLIASYIDNKVGISEHFLNDGIYLVILSIT